MSSSANGSDGRIGTVQVLRPYGDYGAVAYTEKKVIESGKIKVSYVPMLREIVKFFQTGVSPVAEEETPGDVRFHGRRAEEQGTRRQARQVKALD